MVDIDNAIPWSCDTFYYTLANRLGIDTIAKYATSLGFSQKTGIDLPDEVTGTMPSTEWKLKTQHEKWYAGEVISVGIGQGAVTATPLQLARALGGIASGGVLHRPHVVFPDEIPADQLRPSARTSRLRRQDHSPHAGKLADHHRRHGRHHHHRDRRRRPPGRHRLRRQDRHRPGGQPQRRRAPAWARETSAPTPGSSAWRRAAIPTSSSPYWRARRLGCRQPPRLSPPRSSTPSSTSSASARTISASPTHPKIFAPPTPASTTPSGTKPAAE